MRVRDATAGEALNPVDARISATVRALMGAAQVPPTEIATALGTTKTTFYRRLNGGFSAADVAALADFFGVEVSDLYTGLGGKLAPAGCASTDGYMDIRSLWGLAA